MSAFTSLTVARKLLVKACDAYLEAIATVAEGMAALFDLVQVPTSEPKITYEGVVL